MNIQYIIMDALIEYDNAQPTINYLKKNAYYEVEKKSAKDTARNVITFIDKATKKPLFSTEIEIIGIYYASYHIWSWAWAHIGLTNNDTYLSKDILIYALKLDTDMAYLKALLSTSRGEIKSDIQIDINLAICSYIIKQPYIYPIEITVNDKVLIYYYILLNKTELNNLSKKISKNNIDDFLDD